MDFRSIGTLAVVAATFAVLTPHDSQAARPAV